MSVKRLELIDIIPPHPYMSFIQRKGLLTDWIIHDYGNTFDIYKCNDAIIEDLISDSIIDDPERKRRRALVKDESGLHTEIDDGYTTFKYLNNTLHYTFRSEVRNMCTKDLGIYLYQERPLVINDKNFKWKYNSKYNSKESTIKRGEFEYQCIVHASGNGKVIVRYIKGENFHRNKVTIAEFSVEEAYNERFLEAIDKWTKEFKESIAA